MRRRFVYRDGQLVEVTPRRAAALHFIQPDLPGYESPVTGEWIEGRKARREDLKRTGSRPYEGREQEVKEANRARAAQERQLDGLAERMAHSAWNDAPERIRKIFRSK